MRLNALPGVRATVAALPGHARAIRLTLGPFVFGLEPAEALELAGGLIDALEAIRQRDNTNHRQEGKT